MLLKTLTRVTVSKHRTALTSVRTRRKLPGPWSRSQNVHQAKQSAPTICKFGRVSAMVASAAYLNTASRGRLSCFAALLQQGASLTPKTYGLPSTSWRRLFAIAKVGKIKEPLGERKAFRSSGAKQQFNNGHNRSTPTARNLSARRAPNQQTTYSPARSPIP
jgi:hypothetical protein